MSNQPNRPLRPLEIATAPYRDRDRRHRQPMYEGGCLLFHDEDGVC